MRTLYITHDIASARQVPDNIGLLFRRELVMFGPRAELLASGEPVVRQGDAPDYCYIVQRGQVEVVAEGADGPRVLAMLGPGALFGETALLTGAPRNSTVRAVHGALVLRMDGADLLELMRNDQPVADSLWRLTAERARPAQAATATASHDPAQGGDATLTDTRTGAQFRLSPFGFSIWQQLDGERTARDISVNLFEQTGEPPAAFACGDHYEFGASPKSCRRIAGW